MAKIDQIAQDVQVLRERLVEKIPSHFGMKHFITAFFGALFFGFAFVLSGLLFEVGLQLLPVHLTSITLATLLILSAEIYFVGYTRVHDKNKRPFGQFWAKRIFTYYLIALFTSYLLLTLYGVTLLAKTPYNVFRLVVTVSFPTSIGAAVADLLGKY